MPAYPALSNCCCWLSFFPALSGVDIGEAMKTGALWWRVEGKERDLHNPYVALQWGEKYLHMSDGMYFADEEVTYLGTGPQPTGNTSGGHTPGAKLPMGLQQATDQHCQQF